MAVTSVTADVQMRRDDENGAQDTDLFFACTIARYAGKAWVSPCRHPRVRLSSLVLRCSYLEANTPTRIRSRPGKYGHE